MNRKNRTLVLLLLLLCAVCAVCFVADARNVTFCAGRSGNAAVRVRWNAWEAVIQPWYCEAEETYYYILPSALSGGVITNDNLNAALQIDGETIPKYGSFAWEDGRTYTISTNGSGIPARFTATSGLPAVFIETESGSTRVIDTDKANTEHGKMTVFAADGTVSFSGELTIGGRGNSTFSAFSKKPYSLKLDKAGSILGMERDRDFCLLANAWDYSFMNNMLALDMAAKAGFRYVPQAEYADVWINGEYRGVYLIAEKVEVDEDRIRISDLKAKNRAANPGADPAAAETFDEGDRRGVLLDAVPEDITGGYVIERDYRLRADYPNRRFTASYFETEDYGTAFNIKSPEYADAREVDYIRGRTSELEQAIRAEDGRSDAGTHYLDLIDLDSWVRTYMIAEIAYDMDKDVSNTYYYKDTDSADPRFYAGPVWDYDNRFGGTDAYASAEVLTRLATGGWGYTGGWSQYLYEKPEFFEAVCREWNTFFRNYLGEDAPAQIDRWQALIRKSAELDNLRWPRGEGYPRTWPDVYGEAFSDSWSFDREAEYLKNWIRIRCAFLDRVWGENRE